MACLRVENVIVPTCTKTSEYEVAQEVRAMQTVTTGTIHAQKLKQVQVQRHTHINAELGVHRQQVRGEHSSQDPDRGFEHRHVHVKVEVGVGGGHQLHAPPELCEYNGTQKLGTNKMTHKHPFLLT